MNGKLESVYVKLKRQPPYITAIRSRHPSMNNNIYKIYSLTIVNPIMVIITFSFAGNESFFLRNVPYIRAALTFTANDMLLKLVT